ncbi:hypothetical protein BCR39DRAFT_511086 [Naematelia encephala]|uniref:CNNM transmembrane domain-containing protein n=1 Tax=Naematelia encephala TaxID=71784 RepID=A0A1Y2BLF2_9TREE|nr:hypothetical protein BCR39DRAFT_511086 [Naematelia encephala]
MPPVSGRSLSSSLPTLLSLSKLLQAVPQAISRHKRSTDVIGSGVMMHLATAKAPIEPEDPPDSPIFWWKLGFSAGLVLLGGVFAGLTLALMGSDDLNLRVLASSSDDPKERKAAAKVLRLLSRGRHWVLVVLLLGNVIVNESLPIFLDDVLGGGVAAVVVSTTMIVIFGEIIPQAVCVRFGLAIGGVCAPFVFGLMILFAPIAYPTAKLLDYVLGAEEGHTYKKAELKSFLQFHREGDEPLRDDEIGILNGVLSLNDKHAKEIMTPISDCLILPSNKVLDHASIDQILLSGFSRIPIHEPGQKSNFVGMLLVKRLITYNPEDEWPVSKFPLLPLPEARPDINCFQALDYFQTGRAHLLLITESPGKGEGAMGIVSLEDLIEEIIGEEIVDETDRFEDNRSRKAAKRNGTANVMRGIIERQRVISAFANSRAPSRQGTFSNNPAPPSGTQDGLLIQVDSNNNLVAESVSVPSEDTEDQLGTDGRKLVVGPGAMDMITENSEHGSPNSDKKHSGAIGGEDGDQEGDDLIDVLKPASDSLAFPSFDTFQEACLALVDLYKESSSSRTHIGPERTNAGWEWREHKWSKGHGYLTRKTTRHLRAIHLEDESAGVDIDLESEDEESRPLQVSSSTKDESIQVEHSIVFSRTYHVPMLCLRAWDSTGSSLSLKSLLSSGILHDSRLYDDRNDAIMLDPHSPFPLLQQSEHPETGEIVWSIHPCHVRDAVEEILAEEGQDKGALRWLETWLMISASIVNLNWP